MSEDQFKKLQGFDKPTLWYKFSRMANETKSVNLGQGFPDWQPPSFLKENVKKYFTDNAFYQYTRNLGQPKLCEAVARNYEKTFKRNLDPLKEILIGAGAVNILYVCLSALVNEGDEVVVLEPFYDCYLPQVQFSGGKVVGVPMIPPKIRSRSDYQKMTNDIKDDWTIDFETLEKAFNENSRILILNTPNNPTGKILNFEELEKISKLLEKFPRVTLIMDEVYEFQIGKLKELPRMASLPGMFEKSITIMSAGKIFSATGVRIGWAIGPNELIKQIGTLFQWSTFCIADPMQSVIADCLDKANEPYEDSDSYYHWVSTHFDKLRNYFLENLSEVSKKFDFDFFCPEGGYFIIADISKHKPETKYFLPEDENEKDLVYKKDYKFLLNLCHEYKVVGIPCSPFYTKEHQHIGENMIRFAYCKVPETLDNAFKRLNENTKF